MDKYKEYTMTEKILAVIIVAVILAAIFPLLNQWVILFVFNYELSFIQSLVFTIWLALYLGGSRASK